MQPAPTRIFLKIKYIISLLMFLSFGALADLPSYSSGRSKEQYSGKPLGTASTEIPDEIKDVGIEEKTGEMIDLSLIVTNENGEKLPLSTYFKSHKPVILSPVYFSCPGLCNFHLNGLVETLKSVDWSPSNQFEIIALSFDAKETSTSATAKKASYLKVYERAGTENGWHFVTADEAVIKAITKSVGFKFKWNENLGEWAHASAAIVISPE